MSTLRNYEELSIIGRGAYGTVFKAIDRDNNRTVALKRVRIINNSEEKGVPVSTLREITLLKQLDNIAHPNIVRMFDAFQTYSTTPTDSPSDLILTIVFEHVDQDLSQFLRSCPQPGLPEHLIKDLMHQLLNGIDYLHINRMVHRDIKPQNVLITKNKQVKIADFGLARVYGFCKLVTSVVVTLWYRAPEILLQSPYATMVDIWSVGAIMAEMYNRRPLFPGKSEIDQLQKILTVLGSPDKAEWPDKACLQWESFNKYAGIDFSHLITEICPEGIHLIKQLLVFDPNKRHSAKSCLDHPYFRDVECPDSQDSGISMATHQAKKIKYEQKRNRLYENDPSSFSQSPLINQNIPSVNSSRTDISHGEEEEEAVRSTSTDNISSELTKEEEHSSERPETNNQYSERPCSGMKNQDSMESLTQSDENLSKLDPSLIRSDSGLSDSFTGTDQRSFSRADSGICVSPQNVYSDHESSNASSTCEQKDMDSCVLKDCIEIKSNESTLESKHS